MTGPAYADRVAFHRDRLRRTKRTKRAILAEAARLAALLDARDVAYRRLVAHNARLEADRRFAEAITTAARAIDRPPLGVSMDAFHEAELVAAVKFAGVVLERVAELELDHAAEEVPE